MRWHLLFSLAQANSDAYPKRHDDDEEQTRIAKWVRCQRQQYKKGNLEDDCRRKLEVVRGWVWDGRKRHPAKDEEEEDDDDDDDVEYIPSKIIAACILADEVTPGYIVQWEGYAEPSYEVWPQPLRQPRCRYPLGRFARGGPCTPRATGTRNKDMRMAKSQIKTRKTHVRKCVRFFFVGPSQKSADVGRFLMTRLLMTDFGCSVVPGAI